MMLSLILSSVLRHALSGAGGGIVSAGLATQNDVATATGAAVTLANVLWSAWKNWKNKKEK